MLARQMNQILVGIARGVRLGLILAAGALVSACGSDEDDEDVYCCAIRHVASRCSSGASAELQLTIAGWQQSATAATLRQGPD